MTMVQASRLGHRRYLFCYSRSFTCEKSFWANKVWISFTNVCLRDAWTVASSGTYRETLLAVFILGLFVIGYLGYLNTTSIQYLRRFNVLVAQEGFNDRACRQTRVSETFLDFKES